MNFIKNVFKNTGSRIWAIVTMSIAVILIIVTILSLTVLYPLFNIAFGGPGKELVGGTGSNAYYTTELTTKEEVVSAGNALNKEICEEGIILLKNEKPSGSDSKALPLKTNSDTVKVSVFGKNSVNLVYGGSGSGAGNTSTANTLYESLEAAGYTCNPHLQSFYKDENLSGSGRPANPSIDSGVPAGFLVGETEISAYSDSLKESFANYNDMALVVISRTGGEGNDLPRTMKTKFDGGTKLEGAYDADDHYLELDKNEQDMLKMVCENFNRVVVIINSNNAMELGFLDETPDNDLTVNNYDYASKISAALWIGGPGNSGIMALGEILNGTINPSGRTVDTYARDFTADPVWANFGTNLTSDGDQYTSGGNAEPYYFVDYEEGIYVGYRYYETRYVTESDGETWYKNQVVYPFGYGLSYTEFDWNVKSSDPAEGGVITKDSEISIEIEVENTGNVAGKDVIEVYVTSPYTAGEIEKSAKKLVGFEKTDLIEKDGSDSVTIKFDAYDLASYDYNDANNNGFKGYELEPGTYVINIAKNSHETVQTFELKVNGDSIKFDKDPVTEYEVVNRYDEADDQLTAGTLSRTAWNTTWPKTRTAEERRASSDFINKLTDYTPNNPKTEADVYEMAETNEYLLQYAKKIPSTADIQLYQCMESNGIEFDDTLWDQLVAQIDLNSMKNLCLTAAFNTASIDYIGKPVTIDSDGPSGFNIFMSGATVSGTCVYASECVVGSTWNKELAKKMGETVGDEALYGNGEGISFSGWYAPGVNIHRSPFGGRNNEYYSEDGILSGIMAANVVSGAKSKGVYTFMKHFAANDQETHRSSNGICTWVTEQALREIYFKPFEIAVKDGGSTGVMSSFNRIGSVWAGGDYNLLTEVLRNEWGFKGSVICDFATSGYMNAKQMAYAGGDLLLSSVATSNWVNEDSVLDIYIIKQCTKNVLYTVSNSNAMNGIGEGVIYRTTLPAWNIVLIIVDIIIPIGLCVWGFFAIRRALKIAKSKTE